MAFRTLPPTITTTGSHWMWVWMSELVSSGSYSIKGSGDGTTTGSPAFSTTASIFTAPTPYGTGNNAFGNARAWVRLQCLDGTELLIQNGAGATNPQCRILYSLTGTFTGTGNGAISAQVIPTNASGSTVLIGAGTDNAPTYYWISIADPRSGPLVGRCQTSAPYGWWYANLGAAGTNLGTLIFRDPLTGTSASDTDPYVYSFFYAPASYIQPGQIFSLASTYTGVVDNAMQLARMSTSYVAVQMHVACAMDSTSNTSSIGSAVLHTVGSNYLDKKIAGFPIYYGRNSALTAPNGYKGVSTLFKTKAILMSYSGVTLSISSSNDSIVIGDIVADWDGTPVST